MFRVCIFAVCHPVSQGDEDEDDLELQRRQLHEVDMTDWPPLAVQYGLDWEDYFSKQGRALFGRTLVHKQDRSKPAQITRSNSGKESPVGVQSPSRPAELLRLEAGERPLLPDSSSHILEAASGFVTDYTDFAAVNGGVSPTAAASSRLKMLHRLARLPTRPVYSLDKPVKLLHSVSAASVIPGSAGTTTKRATRRRGKREPRTQLVRSLVATVRSEQRLQAIGSSM